MATNSAIATQSCWEFMRNGHKECDRNPILMGSHEHLSQSESLKPNAIGKFPVLVTIL